jgi:hypothetical protein
MNDRLWSGLFFLGWAALYLPLRPWLYRRVEDKIGRSIGEEERRLGDRLGLGFLVGLGAILVVAGLLA